MEEDKLKNEKAKDNIVKPFVMQSLPTYDELQNLLIEAQHHLHQASMHDKVNKYAISILTQKIWNAIRDYEGNVA